MADGITIEFEDEEVERLLSTILKRVKNPGKLMRNIERYVKAVTMKMFRGARPDTKGVRGQIWKKLAPSTIASKAQKRKNGKSIAVHRPLVETGKLRDSLRVLRRSKLGFIFGTRVRSKDNFPYPGMHQVGGRNLPKRKFLFLTNQDLQQIVKMTIDHIKGVVSNGIR